VRELMGFSSLAWLARIMTRALSRVDPLILAVFRPVEEVGTYQAASQAAMFFSVVLGAFNAIFGPLIAELHQRGDREQLNELFKVSTKWGLYVSLPLFLVVALAPRQVMTVVFGVPYAQGAPALALLAAAGIVNVGTGSTGLMLMMTGKARDWLLISALGLAMNVGISWVLASQYGSIGVALGTLMAVLTLFLAGLLRVKHTLGLWPYDRRLRKAGVATLLAGGAVTLVRSLSGSGVPLDLVWLGTACLGVFSVSLIAMGFDPEDRVVWRWLRGLAG